MDQSALEQLERQRLELEENISKLQKSLRHWQTWEIEYEGLREEIAGLPDGSSTEEIITTARDFRAELVDENELQTIIRGRQGGSIRNQSQVLDLLEKRGDYVSRNVNIIEKQLSDAQKKRNVLLLAEDPENPRVAGLPLTDITEELDDRGAVISSKLETPASTTPHLIDILNKAGVQDILENNGVVTSYVDHGDSATEKQNERPKDNETTRMWSARGTVSGDIALHGSTEKPCRDTAEYEKVSNKEDAAAETKDLLDGINGIVANSKESPSPQVPVTKSIIGSNELGDSSEYTDIDPYHPDDTPEDAALRREMLEYGLGEVGAIVAELDLEEGESLLSDEEDTNSLSVESDIDDEDNEDDEDNSEDENGMQKHPAVDQGYIKKMKGLEQKYGMQNVGPDATRLPAEMRKTLEKSPDAAPVPRSALASIAKDIGDGGSATKSPAESSLKPKKKVAFAEEVDVAPESKGSKKSSSQLLKSATEPVKSSIVERQVQNLTNLTADAIRHPHLSVNTGSKSKKPASKFKQTRADTPQTPLFLPPSPPPPPSLTHTSSSPSHHRHQNFPEPNTSSQSKTQPPPPPHQQQQPPSIQAHTIIERAPKSSTTGATPPPPPRRNPPTSDNEDNEDNIVDDYLDDELHRQQIAAEYYKLRNRAIQRQGGFVGEGEAENYGDSIRYLASHGNDDGNGDGDGNEIDAATEGGGGGGERMRQGRKVSRFLAARLR